MLGKLQQHAPSCRAACRMLQWTAAWRTSDAIVSDCDMISKIRARQSVRNEQLYTGHAADGRASATREQEAFHQNPRHIPRHDPVKPYRAGAAATSVALRLEA